MPEWTKSEIAPTRIGFLLCDRFSNLCLANCLEPLRAANTLAGERRFDWQILTPDGAQVETSSGIGIVPHAALAGMRGCDYLFVLVSYDHSRFDTRAMRAGLRMAARRAGVVVGFDTGPWLMAAAGLLDGRRATIHWDLLGAFADRFPGVEVARARVLRDGNRWTCAGALSALDLSLDLISARAGLALRLDVEAMFIRGEASASGTMPGAGVSDPLVQKALGVMRSGIAQPLRVSDLARQLSCQPRTLDRRFRKVLGAPPGEVWRHLRLSAARQMCETTVLSVADIAGLTGYESPAALTRALRRVYGVGPRGLRRAQEGSTGGCMPTSEMTSRAGQRPSVGGR